MSENLSYSIRKVGIFNIPALLRVSGILYKCGKDMAEKYDLHHWDNSHLKNWIIVALCALKNKIYLVYDGSGAAVATFQTRKLGSSYLFLKLATLPELAGRGVGSFCLSEIERLASEVECSEVICEVYDKSEHAKSFYEKRGYTPYGTAETLKYTEIKLKKEL